MSKNISKALTMNKEYLISPLERPQLGYGAWVESTRIKR